MSLRTFLAQLAVFLDGLYGLPLRLPGTPLARALAAKELLLEVLGKELEGLYRAFTDKVREGSTAKLHVLLCKITATAWRAAACRTVFSPRL